MRSESLDEAVSVRADFHGGSVTPVAFRRRGREHRVVRVNARWVDRAGKHPRFYFSVTDENGDVYQLQLQGGDLLWWLDTVTGNRASPSCPRSSRRQGCQSQRSRPLPVCALGSVLF